MLSFNHSWCRIAFKLLLFNVGHCDPSFAEAIHQGPKCPWCLTSEMPESTTMRSSSPPWMFVCLFPNASFFPWEQSTTTMTKHAVQLYLCLEICGDTWWKLLFLQSQLQLQLLLLCIQPVCLFSWHSSANSSLICISRMLIRNGSLLISLHASFASGVSHSIDRIENAMICSHPWTLYFCCNRSEGYVLYVIPDILLQPCILNGVVVRLLH